MHSPSIRFWKTAAAVVMSAAIACGDPPLGPGVTSQLPSDGQVRVSGSVRDFQTDSGMGGARISIGEATVTTGTGGLYSITVPAGDHRVVVDGDQIAQVTMKNPDYRGDFFARGTGCVARYGTVVDARTRQPVSGATVSSAGSPVVQTDQSGWFHMTLGCPGTSCIGFNTTFLDVAHPRYATTSFPAGRGICFVQRVDYELEPR